MIPECDELRTLFVALCGTARQLRCCRPNVQAGQLRPISGRSQFEVSEESLFADVPHVSSKHGQHLLVGAAGLRPPGNGVNGKSMPQVLQTGGKELFGREMPAALRRRPKRSDTKRSDSLTIDELGK
jgi:hypothetical protein